jgi:hypothetical protein
MLLNLQLLRQSDNDLCQRLLNARPELLRQNEADVDLEDEPQSRTRIGRLVGGSSRT